jgi:4-amino-4-deoxy-L-arabinose transferase-like glycosyltransferase
MKALLTKLEKSKSFWFLIVITLVFFFLRLPSLFEPNWYGDEGIYQVLGMAIDHGRMLYSQAWDNKPPLLYVTYALFGGEQFGVRMLALVFGLGSTWLFYFLAQKLFKKHWVNVTITTLFAVLFAIPLLEGSIANAENFMLLPIIAAALIVYHNKTQHAKRYALFGAGLLLGLAFLFKIVALFDFAAFFVFLFFLNWPLSKKANHWKIDAKKMKLLVNDATQMILGFAIPILCTFAYFAINNELQAFIKAAFLGNVGYVGYGNTFFIPQGLLILKTALLLTFVGILAWQRNKLGTAAFFILLWSIFGVYNALFSQRPYTHYVLVVLPAFCLLLGLFLEEQKLKRRALAASFLIAAFLILMSTFKLYSFKRTFPYYQNAFLFITNQKNVTDYQAFFDNKVPRDYQVASYLKMHTKPGEPVFIWGDNSQIYALSHTLPINKYTVAYHITTKEAIADTQKALNIVKPKYVVILEEAPPFPFTLTNYKSAVSLDRAIIYEKDF